MEWQEPPLKTTVYIFSIIYFLYLVAKKFVRERRTEHVAVVSKTGDEDGGGSLDGEELTDLLTSVGMDVTPDMIDDIMDLAIEAD